MTAASSTPGIVLERGPSLRGALLVTLTVALSPGAAAGQAVQPRAYSHADLSVDDPTFVAFSPNDRFLAVGNDRGEVVIFDAEAAREVQRFQPVRGRVVGLAFSADGGTIFIAGENRTIAQVDLIGGEVVRTVETDERIRSLDVSPDGRLLVWGGDDGRVEVLTERLMSQQQLVSPNLYDKRVLFTAFGIDGTEVFAGAEEGRSAFWGLGASDPIRQNELVREEYLATARDAGGQLLVLGVKGVSLTVRAGEAIRARGEHEVQLLDWARGSVVRQIEDLPAEVRAVAVSPDRALVVVALADGTIDAYSAQEARRVLGISEGRTATSLAFSPGGGWLAAATEDDDVLVWEMAGQLVADGAEVVSEDDVLSASGKYEFTTSREPLITSFDRFTLAVLEVGNQGVSDDVAAAVSNLVVSRLANVAYIDLVERSDVEQVLGELRLQNTGVTSAREAARIGELLNAQRVLLGNVSQLGTSVTVALRLVETESARVQGARELVCRNCQLEDLPRALTLLVAALVESR